MGLFKKRFQTNNVDSVKTDHKERYEDIVLSSTYHTVEDEVYGDGSDKYLISFIVNDAFMEMKSHVGEVEMVNVYNPDDRDCSESILPYIAIHSDDMVYTAVEEFKENGTFTGAIALTKLSGKFYFKAKIEYYEDMMYFYGMDRCDGFWDNNGLCIVYHKTYEGTKNEGILMKLLDEVAESYNEQKII